MTMILPKSTPCSLSDSLIPTVILSIDDTIQQLVLELESADHLEGKAIIASNVDCVAMYSLVHYSNQALNKPAFSSITVSNKKESEALGIGVRKAHGVLQVSSMRPNCLLSGAPFQVGDKLISINNIDCTKMGLCAVASMLKKTTGFLTIVVEHPKGDPKFVESMIVKEGQGARRVWE